jgi:cytochrome c oxidase assembly protein subunit 15
VAGGFVAGLDAGHASYTWPRMNEAWWPDGMNTLLPLWRNAFENALAAQFNHRILAYLIVACALYQAWKINMPSSNYLAVAVVAQLLLGILTVLLRVPLAVALLHQFGALCVLALAVWHLSVLTRAPAPDRR